MAYKFNRKESVAANVKRIAREEIDSAVQHLHGKRAESADGAIHEVRKNIKKTRALLRVVRPGLGRFFHAENARLRKAGRQLSDLRDASALIAALDALKNSSGKPLPKQSLATLRRALTLNKKHVEKKLATPELKRHLAAGFARTKQSVKRWPLRASGFAAIEPGLERTFRDGRKALSRARKHGTRENFHELRKRVKDHWYQIRLLESLWSDVMKGYEQSLKEIETALGDALNLAILRESLPHILKAESGRLLPILNAAIDASREELHARALELSAKVYAGKPRQFIREIGRLWEVWRAHHA